MAEHLAAAPRRERVRMSARVMALVGLLGSLLILVGGLAVQQGSAAGVAHVLAQPAMLALNWLPVALLVGLFFGAFGSVFASLGLVSTIVLLVNLANRIKVETRDEPLMPSDLLMMGEAAGAAGDYDLNLHVGILVATGVALAACVALTILVKSAHVRPRWRVAWGVGSAAAAALCLALLYPSQPLYRHEVANNLDSTQAYNFSAVYERLGFNYCFLHFFNPHLVEKPEGYSAGEVQGWIASYEGQAGQRAAGGIGGSGVRVSGTPNVVVVMCESFTDLSADPVFAYASADDNPLRGYWAVTGSGNALASGHIAVTNYGGGTSNTEFDVGTGMQTAMVSSDNPTSFYVLRHDTPSLYRTFAARGYRTYFMHPGYAWFYNRENVYRYLGAQTITFNDVFTDDDMMGGWITDEAFRQRLQGDFTSLTADGRPLFAYGVTIQNHLQYDYGKYVYEGEEHYDPVPLHVQISDEAMEPLAVYLRGVRDSANMLESLAAFLNEQDSPTILVFFGDHRPGLGNSYQVYRELGLDVGVNETPEGVISTYETPFVVWANDAYLAQNDKGALVDALGLGDDATISDNYLGSVVYELAGLTGTDPYYDFLCDARREVPVINHGVYASAEGTLTTSPSDEQQAVATKMRRWEYYRLIAEDADAR